jgi:hypothetical protein
VAPFPVPRRLKRSMRVSRTTLSCTLSAKGYGAHRAGVALGGAGTAALYSTPSSRRQALQAPKRFIHRHGIYPASQILQINGCHYHLTPASHVDDGNVCSRAPLLHGSYPASSLLRTQPPPSRLRPTSRGCRLYDLPCSADFAAGRGRLLQLLSMSLSPCCPYHPAGVTRRIDQISSCHVAFARKERARPPESIF